jgi:REP element-mobilizing transposase RayT
LFPVVKKSSSERFSMPRPLRIEYPGACYHVICRGNARLPIFREDADKELLLDRMIHFAEIYRVEIRAYCVMINHVHIHLRTLDANLGAFMRSFLTSFTSIYNHRHNSCGHVFQGRYKAFILEDDKAYVGKVTQYIHLNPARIRAHEDKPLDARHDVALHFPWSSYGQIMGIRRCPSWLDRRAVLRGWGKTLREKRKNYGHAIESRLLGDIADPAKEAAARAVLGSEEFVDRMRRAMNDISENVNVRRESTQRRKLQSWCSLDTVVQAVESVCGIPGRELRRKGNRGCEARQILLYLAAVKCRGRYSLSAISEQLGPLTISGLDTARSKMMLRLQKDNQLRKRVAEIESILDVKSKAED